MIRWMTPSPATEYGSLATVRRVLFFLLYLHKGKLHPDFFLFEIAKYSSTDNVTFTFCIKAKSIDGCVEGILRVDWMKSTHIFRC